MSAYTDLLAYQRQTEALSQVAGRLGWDQETMMPRGAATQRGEEMAAMEGILHARRTSPAVAEWLAQIDDAHLDTVAQAQMRHIRRDFDRTSKVPADLAARIAQVTSVAQGKWAEARAADDFATFEPVLTEVLHLKREEGAALARDGTGDGDVYDAMLDDYEPGTTAKDIEALFAPLREALVPLRAACLEAAQPPALNHDFDEAAQLRLSTRLAQAFDYDLDHGRIDTAVHPFSSGSGKDVRITTRTALRDPFNCFYSTIHEVGHAAYEQNISDDFLLTPLGRGVSMGVHESQSRSYENQLARSEPFTAWLFEQMRAEFGDFGIPDARTFYRTVNRVSRGFIRTEADEVQYNLHVMLRFDLERALVSGDLMVADLEAAWNDRFLADFGSNVPKASFGCLQDVHWSVGLFGYFPTYAIGNLYAACLFEKLAADVPDLDAALAMGDPSAATGWMARNLQVHGGLYAPGEIIEKASGQAPTPGPLIRYLEQKFTDIYDL